MCCLMEPLTFNSLKGPSAFASILPKTLRLRSTRSPGAKWYRVSRFSVVCSLRRNLLCNASSSFVMYHAAILLISCTILIILCTYSLSYYSVTLLLGIDSSLPCMSKGSVGMIPVTIVKGGYPWALAVLSLKANSAGGTMSDQYMLGSTDRPLQSIYFTVCITCSTNLLAFELPTLILSCQIPHYSNNNTNTLPHSDPLLLRTKMGLPHLASTLL